MREANYIVPNPYYRASGKRSGIPGDVPPERIRLKGAYGEWLMVVPGDVPCMWSFRAPVGLEEARLLLFSWDGKGDPVPVGLADGVERAFDGKRRRIDDVCPVTFNFGPSTKTALLRGERGNLTLDADDGRERLGGHEWRLAVPEGFFGRASRTYACVRWADGGVPELVHDRTIFRNPYLGIGVDRNSPPKFIFLKGGRKDRRLETVLESEGPDWKVEVPEGYFDRLPLDGRVALEWPEDGSPSLADPDADDLPYAVDTGNGLPRSLRGHLDLGFFDGEFGWGGRPLVLFPFVVEADS